jgi:Zn finger protein HypA/HybF involved in hydrogenase expression
MRAPQPEHWTIADFRLQACDAEIRCAHCARIVILDPGQLEARFAETATVLDFRCRACGGRGAAIAALKRRR